MELVCATNKIQKTIITGSDTDNIKLVETTKYFIQSGMFLCVVVLFDVRSLGRTDSIIRNKNAAYTDIRNQVNPDGIARYLNHFTLSVQFVLLPLSMRY